MSASESDASDATRLISGTEDSADDSADDALLEEVPPAPRGPLQREIEASVVDLSAIDDDNEDAVFAAQEGGGSAENDDEEEDDDLPIGLGVVAPSDASSAPRKRLRRGDGTRAKPAKVAKTQQPTVVIKPQPTECTVCYDPCTISGRHRLVSLKCGHVFGKKCIDRWVAERRSCPNCSAAVRKADIRPLFTDHVAVVDNSGVEDMEHKYEAEKSRRLKLETELSRAKLQVQLAQAEAARFQEEMAQWRKQVANLQCRIASDRFTAESQRESQMTSPMAVQTQTQTPTKTPPSTQVSHFGMRSPSLSSTPTRPVVSSPSIATPSGGGYRELYRFPLQNSRVCAIAPSCGVICVGEMFSPTSHGIIKLSTADTRHATRIIAHQSALRDLDVNARNELVLSVAFDGKLAVTNLRSDSVVMQYALPPSKRTAWSCSFSQVDPFAIFCGFQDGTVARYDMRRPTTNGTPLGLYQLPIKQPVHSVQLCPMMGGGHEQLVAATFAGFGVWSSEQLTQPISADGTGTPTSTFTPASGCASLAVAQTRRSRLLVTTRWQPPHVPAKHTVFDLPTVVGGERAIAAGHVLTGFRTPEVISRAAIWESRSGNTMAASWDDDAKSVRVWDVSSQQVRTRLAIGSAGPVVDVQHGIANSDWTQARALLGVLAQRTLVLYGGSERAQA